MAKYKIGAVGTGGIWKWGHSPAWLAHPEVEIVAVCDIVPEKAEAFAKEHNVPHVFTDYKQMLKIKELNVIDVCTPNLLHSEVTVAALKAGKNVFCEKPDAVNVREAEKMAAAAKASRKLLMVMRNNRFNPWAQFLKKFVEGGHMGDVYTGRCGWIRRRGIPGAGGWFTTKALSGGGPLIDLGVHYIDVAMYLMGNPRPVSVVGSTYRKFAGNKLSESVHSAFGEKKEGGTFDVEDLATGFIKFDNGASLQIEFSWASNIEQEGTFLELRGDKAGCSVGLGHELKIFTEIEGTLCDIVPKINYRRPKDESPHAMNLYHFIDCLAGRAKPMFVPQQGVDMIKILTAIYKSAETGKEVTLKK